MKFVITFANWNCIGFHFNVVAGVSNRLIHSMDVQKYDHNDLSLWEMDKALVTGFHPITTQETLINFIAPAAGVEIIYLVRGVQRDAAILVFADKPGMRN